MGLRVVNVIDEEIARVKKIVDKGKPAYGLPSFYWDGQLALLKRVKSRLRKAKLIL